jgi:hypothetical protein
MDLSGPGIDVKLKKKKRKRYNKIFFPDDSSARTPNPLPTWFEKWSAME